MRAITKEQLETVLANHLSWCDGEEDGERADLSYADLSGAYLSGTNLTDANLAGANLSGANLADAYLADAYLEGADLSYANLSGADLSGAYLTDADLAGANLAGANLARADLAGANLAGANLARADLAGAYLADAYLEGALGLDLSKHEEPKKPYERNHGLSVCAARREYANRYRSRHPDVPIVEHLDQRILDAVTTGGGVLNMCAWHKCDTTHCRAGWAIHLAGMAGYELERKLGDSGRAGRAIYMASTGRSPDFSATNAKALEDIRRCAEEDSTTEQLLKL
jgi:hypothetical protein